MLDLLVAIDVPSMLTSSLLLAACSCPTHGLRLDLFRMLRPMIIDKCHFQPFMKSVNRASRKISFADVDDEVGCVLVAIDV